MSIASQIERIQGEKGRIANHLSGMGLAESTATLQELADAIVSITNKGAVVHEITSGGTFPIPAGYHNGNGKVTCPEYKLQPRRAVTPNKSVQAITPDDGFYGLSEVAVGAIPDAYQKVTDVDATAGDVLANKKIVTKDGTVVTGTMTNNGAVNKTLDATERSYTIPAGYHDGNGVVAFPDKYIDTSDADAIANNILKNKTAYVSGAKVTGTMENRGNVGTVEIDALSNSPFYTILSGYYDGGEISISDTLETALAAI